MMEITKRQMHFAQKAAQSIIDANAQEVEMEGISGWYVRRCLQSGDYLASFRYMGTCFEIFEPTRKNGG